MKKLWQALMLVRESDRRLFRRRLVYVVLQSVLPLLNLYFLKLMVDEVSVAVAMGPAWREMSVVNPFRLVFAMAGVFLLQRIVTALSATNQDLLAQRVVDHMGDVMQRQAVRLDMAYYDTPAYYDTLHRAQQEAGARPLQIMNNFMGLFGALLSIGGVTAMLTMTSWWVIAVMVVAVLPGFGVRLLKARQIYQFRKSHTETYRRTHYYNALLSSRDYAKEMRVYGLSDFFRSRYVGDRRQLVEHLTRISRRLCKRDIASGLVEALALLAVVWLLLVQAFEKEITVGTFVMLFEAFRRGQGYLTALVASVATLYDNRLFVGNLFEYLDMEPTVLSPEHPQPLPERIETVELRDISFRYPGMDRDVLSHYSLVARRGEVARIAGENGYGKSTVVKLLLRLYDPDDGAVLVNGTDIRMFDLAEWRRQVGVLFQDFVRYNLTAAENIGFADGQGVERAAREAHADTFLETLPRSYDTMLGRAFDGGAELSMGQWQRVALARALHREAPVVVLDEPTAWMDTEARAHLAEEVERLRQDKIVFIITHT